MSRRTPQTKLKADIKRILDRLGIPNFPITQGLGSYPGLGDRVAFFSGETWWLEVKSPRGKLSDHQKKFKKVCEEHEIPHLVVKSVEDLIRGMDLPLLC